MTDPQIETEIIAKGKTAPRVTPADIKVNIDREYYFNAANGVDGFNIATVRASEVHASIKLKPMSDDPDLMSTELGPLQLLTFCVLVLQNGFTVTGESACASPENFDAEIGRKIARENAVAKIWPLMGYALRTQLSKGE